jgi:hypothetical protein
VRSGEKFVTRLSGVSVAIVSHSSLMQIQNQHDSHNFKLHHSQLRVPTLHDDLAAGEGSIQSNDFEDLKINMKI